MHKVTLRKSVLDPERNASMHTIMRVYFNELQFVDINIEGEMVEIRGSETIAIQPRGANDIWITPARKIEQRMIRRTKQ